MLLNLSPSLRSCTPLVMVTTVMGAGVSLPYLKPPIPPYCPQEDMQTLTGVHRAIVLTATALLQPLVSSHPDHTSQFFNELGSFSSPHLYTGHFFYLEHPFLPFPFPFHFLATTETELLGRLCDPCIHSLPLGSTL